MQVQQIQGREELDTLLPSVFQNLDLDFGLPHACSAVEAIA